LRMSLTVAGSPPSRAFKRMSSIVISPHPSRWWRFHNRAAERSVRAIASKAAWVMAMRIIRLTVTFRYFVGLHSRAIRSASAI
jgi:hypothetical protein